MKKEYDIENKLHREAKEVIIDLEYDVARQRALNQEREAQAEELQRTISDLLAEVSGARSCAYARPEPSLAQNQQRVREVAQMRVMTKQLNHPDHSPLLSGTRTWTR